MRRTDTAWGKSRQFGSDFQPCPEQQYQRNTQRGLTWVTMRATFQFGILSCPRDSDDDFDLTGAKAMRPTVITIRKSKASHASRCSRSAFTLGCGSKTHAKAGARSYYAPTAPDTLRRVRRSTGRTFSRAISQLSPTVDSGGTTRNVTVYPHLRSGSRKFSMGN